MHFPLLPPTLAHILTTLIPTISATTIANTDPNQKPMIDTFRKSCVNWQVDSKACALSGICKLTDDSHEASHPKLHGWRETNLDLNQCIWFDAKESILKWFEEKDGKVEDLSGHKRDTWSSLNLTERIANGGGHFECFGRKGN
ncbi:hypothetical protein NEUTE1DRAFT_101482 [Neurospora tetrasperma FGSC 2508]|uniref:Cyanovirin-N domain-containing protein n=1 Tax=Neurospora tetrasperma (strain FGSC 2508 / ATCC MYA-4615 / P0657) TaxID=510951 RepID=F8MNS8_NEUT8|nr:uncharacterized protein NEUTE1DRAFT_101482 [Neurospora tetrasperma FGSC 2508]EGO56200.1 hypothetical protein NEUTE1DRAFT_101482 [Neurospora tetrasperma FGSC 2508]EGZ70945.1 hypothetical protein NEUTE2DRAFT_114174 [Neurospora tetrasperma FGSC 2509]